MNELTKEENLIVSIARATCFAYKFKSVEIPRNEIEEYVDHLISIFKRKPYATLHSDKDQTVEDAVKFCIERLEPDAPEQARKLREVLHSTQ